MATANTTDQNQWHSGECWDPIHIHSIQWTVPTRYQGLAYIGHGAFGSVMRATDTKTNKTVAIKKQVRAFDSSTHAKRTYRELRLLQHVNHPDANVIQLYNVFTPEKTLNEFKTLYFVFNFFELDVHRLIERGISLPESDIRLIIYSILRGLKYIHAANIIHRDITPRNIGVSPHLDVAILDLGLARVSSSGLKTGYVVARWWRAPEVIVNKRLYDNKLDIWSVGCIMAELLRRRPLFPGSDYIDQLRKIIEILGTPTEQELNELCLEDERLFILNELANIPPTDFHTLFPTLSEQGLDFIQSVLRFDPRRRPSAEEALAHPFFTVDREGDEDPTASPIEGLHDDAVFTVQQWKTLIWELIQNSHEPAWALERADNVTH